jgi:Spy/CpxP family protein refolding chaperone
MKRGEEDTMKKILRVKICTQLIVYLFAIAPVAYAQPSGPPQFASGPGEDELVQMEQQKLQLFHYLQLTTEQKAQLDANRVKHWREIYTLQQQIRAKRDALRAELENPQLDVKKTKDLHGDLKVLYGKIEDIHLEGILGVRQILNPQQFSRFIKFDADIRSHHTPIRN